MKITRVSKKGQKRVKKGSKKGQKIERKLNGDWTARVKKSVIFRGPKFRELSKFVKKSDFWGPKIILCKTVLLFFGRKWGQKSRKLYFTKLYHFFGKAGGDIWRQNTEGKKLFRQKKIRFGDFKMIWKMKFWTFSEFWGHFWTDFWTVVERAWTGEDVEKWWKNGEKKKCEKKWKKVKKIKKNLKKWKKIKKKKKK